jgi:hypothetical protein
MSKLNSDGDSSKGKTQHSVRTTDELKDAFARACDSVGKTQTDVTNELMREFVDEQGVVVEDGGSDPLPTDETLREAYRALRRKCPPDRNRLGTDVAESAIAESTRVKRSGVRRQVLEPLERAGCIVPRWGSVRVVPLSEIDSTAGGESA